MTTMRRVRVTWDGIGGLPGLSTFYMGVASPSVAPLVTFYGAIKGLFPPGLSWTIPSSGDELDDATGNLTGSWSGTGGSTVAANGVAGSYAAGVGAIVLWKTGVIHNARRVQGRSFLSSMLAVNYENNGTITTGALSTIQTAANALVASGVAQGIWSRGRTPTDGLYCALSSATVPDRVSSLRSRRT